MATECIPLIYRVTCSVARPRLISNIQPEEGYTAWCQRCKQVELVRWESLSREVIQQIHDRLERILASE